MDLHTAGHRRGVVCAPHSAAVEAGRAILAEGGNVLEAMVAMAAMIAVAYPHMNHLGGDGYWLVREPSGRVRAFLAAGVAGARAAPQLYRDAGHDTIPARRPLAAPARPGPRSRALRGGAGPRVGAPRRGRGGAGAPPCRSRICSRPPRGSRRTASSLPATSRSTSPVTPASSRACRALPTRS